MTEQPLSAPLSNRTTQGELEVSEASLVGPYVHEQGTGGSTILTGGLQVAAADLKAASNLTSHVEDWSTVTADTSAHTSFSNRQQDFRGHEHESFPSSALSGSLPSHSASVVEHSSRPIHESRFACDPLTQEPQRYYSVPVAPHESWYPFPSGYTFHSTPSTHQPTQSGMTGNIQVAMDQPDTCHIRADATLSPVQVVV
jgi:hypothetical protein